MNRYEVYLYETRKYLVSYEVLATKQEVALKKVLKGSKNLEPIETQFIETNARELRKFYLVETKVKREKPPKKSFGRGDNVVYQYSHVACPGYPNCDEDPMGCRIYMGDNVEEYGMRD
jgi:hypothetical protein